MDDKSEKVAVWDLFVRFFHWVLVGSVTGMYLSGEHFRSVHTRLGYFIICLVFARLVWGFIGREHALFKDFLYSPATIYQYLLGLIKRNPKHYLGHNPAGGIMIVILLVSLLVTAFAGLKVFGQEGHGPLASSASPIVQMAFADQDEDDHDEKNIKGSKRQEKHIWENVHEAMTAIMLFLIVVHIGGVATSSWIHKENLVLSMITGKKKLK